MPHSSFPYAPDEEDRDDPDRFVDGSTAGQFLYEQSKHFERFAGVIPNRDCYTGPMMKGRSMRDPDLRCVLESIEMMRRTANPSSWMNETWGPDICDTLMRPPRDQEDLKPFHQRQMMDRGHPSGTGRPSAQYGGGRKNTSPPPRPGGLGKKKLKKTHRRFTSPQAMPGAAQSASPTLSNTERSTLPNPSQPVQDDPRNPDDDDEALAMAIAQSLGAKEPNMKLTTGPILQFRLFDNRYIEYLVQREHGQEWIFAEDLNGTEWTLQMERFWASDRWLSRYRELLYSPEREYGELEPGPYGRYIKHAILEESRMFCFEVREFERVVDRDVEGRYASELGEE